MWPRPFALALTSSLLACGASRAPTQTELSPGVVFPHAIAEGKGDDMAAIDPSPLAAGSGGGGSVTPTSPGGGASATTAGGGTEPAPTPSKSDPPDPEPLRLADQWEYEIEMKRGKLAVLAARPRRFPKPVVSARRFGRYAVELWIGNELVDRVRFDFPGLAGEEPLPPAPAPGAKRPLYAPVNLTSGAEVRQKVLVPAAPRARRARLVDRATGEALPIPWPPETTGSEASKPPAPSPPAAASTP